MEKVQNLFIGFGKGAKTLAATLASKGEEVVLVEESVQMYGGTCINIACIPSKNLKFQSENGYEFTEAIDNKNELTAKLRETNYHNVDDNETAKVVDGKASFLADNQVKVDLTDGGSVTYQADRIFINTGATPNRLPIDGANLDGVEDATSVMELTELPEKLVIIGSGYIGTEFAATFNNFGSKVTVLEASEDFLPAEEPDVISMLLEDLKEQGISFEFAAETTSIQENGQQLTVHYQQNGQERSIDADKVLMAVGRTPNTDGLGLDNTSIQLTDDQAISVDEHLRTDATNVWAMGDVKGGPQFTYVSLDDNRIVESQLVDDKEERTTANRPVVPHTLFTNPPLTQVGLTEAQAKQAGKSVEVFETKSAGVPKANLLFNTRGKYKVIVDKDTKLILGATIYAEESHETLNLISLAMNNKLPYTALRDQIYTHPTMSEVFNSLFG